MDQVLRNTSRAMRVVFYVDAVPTDATSDVTVTVTRDDGTVLVTNATTTKPPGTTGVYEWILPAQANLDRLRFDWMGTIGGLVQTVTTWVEIVGGFYVTLSALRDQPNLGDTTKFSTVRLEAARRWFEETFERFTKKAFVPRYASEDRRGKGSSILLFRWRNPRVLRGVLADDVVAATTGWELLPYGGIERPTGVFARDVTYRVRYEHGLDMPPEDVSEACLLACRLKLLTDQSGTRSRELSIRNEYGNVTISQPGPARPFGIPEVDEVANGHRAATFAIG